MAINQCLDCEWVGDDSDMIWTMNNHGAEDAQCPECFSEQVEEIDEAADQHKDENGLLFHLANDYSTSPVTKAEFAKEDWGKYRTVPRNSGLVWFHKEHNEAHYVSIKVGEE